MADWADLLLDPTAGDKAVVDTRLAARRPLTGARIALVDNGKANAGFLLSALADELSRRFGAQEVLVLTKDDAGTTLESEAVAAVAEQSDLVLTAVGDCGSCSAATLADAILLDRAGVPAVGICSDAFRMSADAMADAYGFPGFEYVRVPHPVASLDRAAVEERVRQVFPQVLAILGAAG
jgi:hypothetical protein